MRILCNEFSNALYYILEGWRQVFVNTGHQWRWMGKNEAPLDVFDEYKPDIYIGTTYEISSALTKALKKSPNTKIILKGNNWGPSDDEIDLKIYPIGVADTKRKKMPLNSSLKRR